MTDDDLPAFEALRRRYLPMDEEDEAAETAFEIPLPAALAEGDDPMHVLSYIRSLGASVHSLDDVYEAVNALAAEEELSAFRCREGVAVSQASDGRWMLFTAGDSP